jgi:hypothetical protein
MAELSLTAKFALSVSAEIDLTEFVAPQLMDSFTA